MIIFKDFVNLIEKNVIVGLTWWLMPVIPATRKAEAGELLELRRQKLQ